MELNNIKSSKINWGDAANDLNQNFGKINNAIEQVKNVTTRNKGYFSSSDKLLEAYPSAHEGDIAYVKRSGYTPFERWRWNGAAWEGTGESGGNDNVSLGDYYTQAEIDGKFTNQDEKLSELGSEVRLTESKIRWTNSEKFNPYIKELYIEGEYNGKQAKELGLYIEHAGKSGDGEVFLFIASNNISGSKKLVFVVQQTENFNGYRIVKSEIGLTLHIISTLSESMFGWNEGSDNLDNSLIKEFAFNLDFSPSIKSKFLIEGGTGKPTKFKEIENRVKAEKGISRSMSFINGDYIYNGKYIDSNGVETDNAKSQYTGFISVKKGDRFKITAATLYGDPCVWIKYDVNANVLSYDKTPGVYRNHVVEIEEGVEYIRFSSFNDNLPEGMSFSRIDESDENIPTIKESLDKETKQLSKNLEYVENKIEKIESDIYESIFETVDVRKESWSLEFYDDIREDKDGYKSKIYQNTSNDIQILRIFGTSNPWVANATLYGFTFNEPYIGLKLDSVVQAEKVSQPIDSVVKLEPSQWIIVNGYANELNIELKVEGKAKVDTLASKGNVLYGKKYAFCGDSFTEAIFDSLTDEEGRTGKESPEFYDNKRKMWKSYAWHIVDRNDMKYYADGKSGSTMGVNYNSDGTVDTTKRPFAYERYKNVPKDSDYITLMFGLNEIGRTVGTKDSTDDSTLWGAYNKVLEYFITEMPYAKIGIIIPDAWESEQHRNAIIEIATYWGIPYLDLIGDASIPMQIGGRLGINISPKARSLRNAAFQISTSDSHPNPNAQAYRSTTIENWLRSL